MSVINSIPLIAAGDDGYQISRSVRLRSSATAYLSKATVGTPTNKSKWTMSMWVKRGALSSNYFSFFGKTINASANFSLYFNTTTDQIIWNFNNTYFMTTSQVFRDPSSWYHFVFVWDSANATAALRARIYCNGSEITSWATDNRANITTSMDCWNTNDLTYPHTIGAGSGSPASLYYDGYLTEVNFIDGQALTPNSFGETDSLTGVWKPKKYAGTYGTNGFYLNFADNSAATATAIGKDSSGNGNNWTPNNISVTAGVTYDSMLDVPTMWADGGNGRGNYCTLNPLDYNSGTVSNGNLQWSSSSAVGNGCFGSFAFDIADSTNKYYWEMTLTSGDVVFGIVPLTTLPSNTSRTGSYNYYTNGNKYSGTSASAYGSSFTSGDVIGVAVGAGVITFYKNGTSQGSAFTGLTGFFKPAIWEVSGVFAANFGQRPFAYTPPTGFKALNTQNIAAGSITTSGTFTGNASAEGPFVFLNGVPTVMTINGNAVTFATHVDKTANGFKLRTSSSSYNASGSNTYSITTTGAKFKYANAQVNP